MKGKVTLITGASRGIGRAIALDLAHHGSDLALLGRDRTSLGEVAELARLEGSRVITILADMTDGDALDAAVEETGKQLGALHHVVANAGITVDQLTMRLKPQDWDRVIAVNLTGSFRLVRASLKGMVRARYGRIVMISSVAGLMGNPGQAAYAASKAGIVGLVKSLAKEIASRGITVNAVAPGLVETSMALTLPAARRREMIASIPLVM